MTDTRLVYWGMVLFLCSLLTGLLLVAAPPFVANPRGVLAGHLEAAMNGMFLMIVGLFISRIRLSSGQMRVCRAALLYGAFSNWVFTTTAGVLGTSDATPLAGAGHKAGAFAEQAVLAGLVTVAVATVVAAVLLFIGLHRATAGAAVVETV